VWGLTSALATTALVLFAAAGRHPDPVVPGFLVPTWALVGLFFVADVLVVHLVFRREAHTFSLSEVPLVIGLFFVPTPTLVGAQLLGAGAALVLHRRQRPIKLCFNLAHMALEATIAVVAFRFLDSGADPLAFRAVAVACVATAAAVTIGTLSISTAISLYEGRPDPEKLAASVLANFVAGLANTAVGLVAVGLLFLDPGALWLLAVPTAALFTAYRSLTHAREKQESLEFLYEASRVLHRGGSLDEPMVELLTLARETFHAEVAELILLTAEGGRGLRTAVGPGSRVRRLEPARTGPLVPSPRVMAAALVGERRLLGSLAVSGPSQAQGRFSSRQVQLFETFANHVTVALENGLLETSLAQVTALKEELHYQAFHDDLTGLGNRSLFVAELEGAVDRGGDGEGVAVLFVDLDDFKTVNDTLGHAAGDELLVRTAERLRGCLRPGDVAARLGGDEFAVLVVGLCPDRDAVALAERLLGALREPVVVQGERVHVGASVGMATATADASTAGELLRNADIAMYTAKVRGKNRWELFEPAMRQVVAGRHEAKRELQRALDRHEFVLHYQPVVDMATGAIVAAEALVRWEHPERGLLPPGEFVPVAEDLGLIGALGRLVLEEACAEAGAWQQAHQRATPIALTVNVSAREFDQVDFVSHTAHVLRRSGVAQGSVVLEITESAMVDGPALRAKLRDLRAAGARLAVDDFGTGYSSLSYLDGLAIDILKIAKPFVDKLAGGELRPALAQAVVNLGEALRLDVVAEGVETPDQIEALWAMGCRLGQGYVFGRPVDAAALRRLLAIGSVDVPGRHHTSRTSPSCITETTWVPSRV
jgi:diguanylate cyclase (GGDEF)-like protein